MKCHQILTGACNVGDRCFAVGSVEGIPFTAYAAGCNIVILANTFERVQVVPGVCHDNIQISCVDCSTDTGKIAAAYGKLVCIFEPTPLVNQNSGHRLDYCWIQTGMIEAQCYINTLSWNLEGTRLLTAGDALQLWASPALKMGGDDPGPVHFDIGDEKEEDELSWSCIWTCVTATPTVFLSFSPDGTLFATASSCDRLVKIWYDNKHVVHPVRPHEGTSLASDLTRTAISFGYIYLPHPGAVTGFSWRTTSKYMPKGSVSNMLVTSCRDNICRVWVETVLPDDGLVSLNHLDPVAAQNPRFRTHRHKHRFMQRLKHIKACFHIRRQVKGGGGLYVGGGGMSSCLGGIEPLPTLPSSYSVHDFHQYGVHASGMTPGFHFHLAASINAETDIPLVPSISGTTGAGDTEQNFVLHWLNNKEMHFSAEAENILLEISRRAMEKETVSGDHDHQSEVSDLDDPRIRAAGVIRLGSRTPSRMTVRTRSVDEDDPQSQQSTSVRSHQALSAATSSTSIATDVTTATTAALGDALDRRIETLLRDWHQTSDVLFSIHPVDGSLLVWIIDFLDNYPGSFRQAQVSFSARIPNALPLGDAMTMSPNLAIYNGSTPSFLKQLLKLELAMEEESRSAKSKSKSNLTLASTDESDGYGSNGSPSPIISMTTKHSNGSLNLWHLTVAEESKFTQVLNISHFTRVCGHRFQLNDIKCHPVLPLLLSTSHHNKKESSPSNLPHSSTADDTPLICIQDTTYKDWCSELILWRVDAVGPLSKSGGVTELARINSPQVSAFSNVAWIPTLLPSTTLGSVSNSPSACFVASDGENLRVYQAVIDGRALLAEISTAERKKRMMESTLSLSSDSSLQEQRGQQSLADIFNIVSEQSTARPGCVIQLDIIKDASNDWQNTQFLHVLQEGLIRGERAATTSDETGPFDPHHAPMVDLQTSAVFEEPFYITLLEKTTTGSVIHMWRLVIASQHHTHEGHEGDEYGSGRSTPVAGTQAQRVDASPVVIKTAKICAVPLPLPVGVEVIHASPTAGHLSSASIYPACFSPYVLVTACSDKVVRFWRCRMTGDGDDLKVQWHEWNMVSKDSNSSIKVPGRPLHVSAAYSGRMACAYQTPGQESAVVTNANGTITFACSIAIYECESTGGSQWILEDKFDLRDILATQAEIGHDLDLTYLSQLTQGKSLSRLTSALSSEDVSQGQTPIPYSQDHPAADALHSVSSQLLVPSPSTLQCLRSNKFDKRGVSVKQKHPIQIDWVSKEDGSHILTVTVGSKVLLYTAVADDVAVLASKDGKSEGDGRSRPMLQKTLSMPRITDASNLPRWMGLERFSLVTADGLAPLPMQMSWVRDGILVVGMDNEMHVYSQWRQEEARGKVLSEEQDSENSVYERDLTEAYLKSYLQEASHNLKTATSMSRVTSYSVLSALETKRKKGLSDVMTSGMDECALLWPTLGLFEASHMASPVLPQYHPRQLIELLNSGKIKRVKAILAHLLRCLSSIGQRNSEALLRGSISDADDARTRSWSRSRTLSVSGGGQSGSVSREGRGSISLRPEELTLDYVEITAIPPLPLWLLLEADKDTQCQHTVAKAEKKEDTYAELFGAPSMTIEDDLTLDEEEGDIGPRRISLTHESKGIAYFGPRQAQILSTLLTHTHLPGLSSLDQMHLLALGDTVASCNVDFADRFDINKAKEAMAREAYSRSMTDEPSMEALDDCGVRFLLAMRHHTYLLRCLPIGQRATLQKGGIGSHNIVWAFHSESQEELLDFIPSVRQSNPRWSELRELGIGWWVRNNSVLAKCMQKVAKAAFQVRNDPLDAAIYYLAMKKKSLVWGLFRSINDRRMTDFFSNNFSEERWRKAALKNAFALLGKQRFEQAAGFFLLAGALKDAIEVVLNKLEDLQLAMVIIRLYEGELEATPPSLCKLLHEVILGCDINGDSYDPAKAHPDPFLRSIAHWILRDYGNSLNTLLQTDPSIGIEHKKHTEAKKNSSNVISADPSVFNFYIYLRTHPLLIRQCIANTAKDSGGSLMASRFGPGQDSLDKKSVYESSMTPLERRLYFTTSHAHLRSGCPTLALEVLSKLPDNVIDPDNPEDGDLLGSPVKEKKPAQELIHSGTLESADSFDWSKPTASKDDTSSLFGPTSTASTGLDWSTPMSFQSRKDDDDLDLDFSIGNEDDEDLDLELEEDKQKPKELSKEQTTEGAVDNSSKRLDIMAQQLKFVSCLKMMMEELATLATGCEVDGGQLRYQLYVWLEREVEALKEVCNYRSTLAVTGEDLVETGISEETEKPRTPSPIPTSEPSTLHEILQQEKLEFEAKMERAAKRKRWLTANQQLLRTLLSYCSLHGSSGGGLASVRMELVLLLQELQQESSKQQLLSPLPFPTTLPLLSASIASNKTVVSDPIRHLQAGTHDLLQSLVEIKGIARPSNHLMTEAVVLRNLAAALSACIYQSLCDSETFTVKAHHRVAALGVDIQHVTEAHRESHLVGRDSRSHIMQEEEPLQVCTPPAKWPGVTSLLALIARERDEDTPKLTILLCEAYIAVYLSLLVHGIATCDAYVLYRLTAQPVGEKEWATLFGGGVKKLLKVITNVLQTQTSVEKDTGAQGNSERLLSTFSNLQKTRIKFNMKLLGQLGFQDPRTSSSDGDTKPAYREQFLPPDMSIVSQLMKKPPLPLEYENIDYDSSTSDEEELEDEYEEDDDIFKEPKNLSENNEHCDPDSYSWCLLRMSCVLMAQVIVNKFLEVAGVELQELPMQSPLLHSILRVLDSWLASLVTHLEGKKGPPPEYIPGCFADTMASGPAILKYRGILEKHNTPFVRGKRGVKPVERLWNYLVRQEHVQHVFVRYIFGRKRPIPEPVQHIEEEEAISDSGDGGDGPGTEVASEAGVGESHHDTFEHAASESNQMSLEPVKVIHKDQDSITAFCINKINPGSIALATVKEVQELDMTLLLEHPAWLINECELDVLALNADPESVPPSNYMVVQTPMDKGLLEGKGPDASLSTSSSINFSGISGGTHGIMSQSGRGTNVLKELKGVNFPGSNNPRFCRFIVERSRHYLKPVLSHRIEGVRRMTSHPVLPLYMLGCQDGSVVVREWHHSAVVARPRPGGTFAKVARLHFNQQGNKFGVMDGDGNLSLFQLGLASQTNKPFYSHQCHTKHGSDFVFVGSSSLIATAGQSSEHRNVAMWDTLMPQRKANVVSWNCHDNGASALIYAPQHQVLISAGKKGTVCIFDIRQRSLRHKFQAHDGAIKCTVLDPSEEFFCTGSADGDIKVWGLSIHTLVYNLPGEHSRSSLFKNLSQGVTQLHLDTSNRLFSCGADGSIKLRQLPERDLNINML